jgi:hypothetical protein
LIRTSLLLLLDEAACDATVPKRIFDRTVAVTPTKSKLMDAADVKRVCHDYTVAGLQAIYEAGPAKPFRFLYMSGYMSQRDPLKKPFLLGDYAVMRVSQTHLSLELS